MRSVAEQQTLVTASAIAPRPVRVGIFDAQNLLSAEDIIAEKPVPHFDQSAIDGYAVRSIDVLDAGTKVTNEEDGSDSRLVVTLPVVGYLRAGDSTPTRLSPKQAVRVDIGSPLPTLADAVVPLKWADGGMQKVRIGQSVRSGDYIRRVGNDVQPGDVLVKAGSIIGATQIGLLAAIGCSKILVHPRPRVSIISVGKELVEVDENLGDTQIHDLASYALAAAARDAGADVSRIGVVSIEDGELSDVVQSQISRAEIIAIAAPLGGEISAKIRESVLDLGVIEEERVSMHPGAIQGFGVLGEDKVPTFLLPANPLAALTVFEVMVRPLIRIALGKRQPLRRVIVARTLAPIESFPSRRGFVRGQLLREEDTGAYLVQPLGANPTAGSHLLHTLADANCLIILDEDQVAVSTGDKVSVLFLAQRS